MKYSTVILALVASVFAVPQGSTITSAPVSVASANLTPQQSCLVTCQAGDVDCQAACIGSAHPNTAQVVDTNKCAAKCDQGDGSTEATQKFRDCVQACISGHYLSTAPVEAAATNAASSAMNSVASTVASGTGAVTTGTESTGAAASSTPTGAASSHAVQIAGAGLAGLFALFAL